MAALNKKRALAAMSGGVDSSVSAALLKDQGYDVVGVCMQVWDYSKSAGEEGYGTCCSSADVEDARAVSDILKIPFYVLDCEKDFREKVINPFVEDYLQGKTPIPCVQCNTFLKFDYLAQKMRELECDILATGHYAQIQTAESGAPGVFKSEDRAKDQTYFLFTLQRELIPKLAFPVGGMEKDQARDLARAKGLPVFGKKDSTGICFIGKGGYKSFVERESGGRRAAAPRHGALKLHASGEEVGRHNGIHQFTIGQRRGLGVSFNKPLFVVKIEKETGDVFLGPEESLYSKGAELEGLSFLDDLREGEELTVKVRFHHQGARARAVPKGALLDLNFLEAQKSVAPGQPAVFYRGDQLLGGGFIKRSF